jgi:hypothetical protein
MKSIKAILRSPNFMREVSILLFGFAAVGGLFSMLLLTPGNSAPEALASGVGMLAQSIVYVVLGIMIRRGSAKALWVTGVLFTLDTSLIFVLPYGNGLGAMILWRGILIFMLVRYIRRQRAVA